MTDKWCTEREKYWYLYKYGKKVAEKRTFDDIYTLALDMKEPQDKITIEHGDNKHISIDKIKESDNLE